MRIAGQPSAERRAAVHRFLPPRGQLESHPSGLEACAQNLLGMRPAWRARYPAVTAAAIAAAIVGGSAARVTAVAKRTASKPNSIAIAAALAVPITVSR